MPTLDEQSMATAVHDATAAAQRLSATGGLFVTLVFSKRPGDAPGCISWIDGAEAESRLPRNAVDASTLCRRIDTQVRAIRDAAQALGDHAKAVVGYAAELLARYHAHHNDGEDAS